MSALLPFMLLLGVRAVLATTDMEPCDRDAIWVEDSGGPRNHLLDGGPDALMGSSNYKGGRGVLL